MKFLKWTGIAVLAVAGVVILSALTTHFYLKLNPKAALEPILLTDDINLKFVDDPEASGVWESVDFINETGNFRINATNYKGDLFLKRLVFNTNGVLLFNDNSPRPWFKWTKGVITHSGDKTASRYMIKNFSGKKYLFLEWKSGDYTIRHMKPYYYVLKFAGLK